MVAKDIKHKWDVRDELFAATLPLEAFRLVLSHAATVERGKRRRCVMTNDVRRAYFHARAMGEIDVEIPDEDKTEQDVREDNVGRLNLCLYGTREAAAAWQQTVIDHLNEIGFNKSALNPCVHGH